MRVMEFFEDPSGKRSMTKLLAFMSFFPASSVLAVSHSDTALGLYLSVYAAQTVGSKLMDAKIMREKNASVVTRPARKP